jgi:hypothetical protein
MLAGMGIAARIALATESVLRPAAIGVGYPTLA